MAIDGEINRSTEMSRHCVLQQSVGYIFALKKKKKKFVRICVLPVFHARTFGLRGS